MNDAERILGRLEEFKSVSERRLQTIEEKIDALQQFKWRLAGGALGTSFIATIIVQTLQIFKGAK